MDTVKQKSRQTEVHVRWMIRRDMPEVLQIEQDAFAFPWSEDDFIEYLRQRNCIGMVADNVGGTMVLAFMLYEMHKNRLELLNFAVSPWWHRAGIGRQMVAKLRTKLSKQRRTHVRAVVRETNTDALLFFKAMGFEARSIVSEPWPEDSSEDGIEMILDYLPTRSER